MKELFYYSIFAIVLYFVLTVIFDNFNLEQENFDPSLIPVSSIVTLAKVAQKLVNGNGTLTNPGNLQIGSGATTPGNLTITGGTVIQGSRATTALGVTGATILSGSLNAGATTLSSATVSGSLGVTGNTTVGGTLNAGATTLSSATINGVLNAGATTLSSATVSGSLGVTGNTTVGGTLNAGDTTLSSAIVSGTLNAGATTLSSATVTNNTTVNGTLIMSNDTWHQSKDGKNRLNFGNNKETYYGSANGMHYFRTGINGNEPNSVIIENNKLTVSGNLSVSGTLNAGVTTLSSATVSGVLNAGDTTLSSATVNGNLCIGSTCINESHLKMLTGVQPLHIGVNIPVSGGATGGYNLLGANGYVGGGSNAIWTSNNSPVQVFLKKL